MTFLRCLIASSLLLLATVDLTHAEEPVHWQVVNQIRDEGFHRSQVMATVQHLTDIIGPRLTGSPASHQAQEWTRQQLATWGLEAAQLEAYEFGHGWTMERASLHLVSPRRAPLTAFPKAWTPGTDGPVRGALRAVTLESEDDLEEHRGKLAGTILLLLDDDPSRGPDGPPFRRWEDHELEDSLSFEVPSGRTGAWRKRMQKRFALAEKVNTFLAQEGVLAVLDNSSRAYGIVRTGGGGSYGLPERHRGVPTLTLVQEHYNLLQRLLDEDQEVEVEVDVAATFHEQDTMAYNTLADLPGSDLADEIVLLGGHLDSWHLATGATDNAAACAVMMEAMRILKAIDAKPRRTIRIGLWSGEEQGLLGSRHHVEQRLADRPESQDERQLAMPERLRDTTWPIRPKPGHDDFSVYFNLDNGGGKIRGVWSQENAAVVPIFEAWLQPFADLGASTVSINETSGTDHLAFDSVGLPGFQFIQDPMDYRARTHHTQLDTLDYVVREDLMQASVIVASFAYHAAMRDQKMPRKPLPREPPAEEEEKEEEEEEEAAGEASAGESASESAATQATAAKEH